MAEIPDLTGRQVLIVDDDPEVVTVLSQLLGITGAEVTSVADGNAAVEACEKRPPDLMILDMMLPKRSGFLVMEKIRAARAAAAGKPAIVMITGNQGKKHKEYAETLGVDDYINKPFTAERLMRSVARALKTG